MCTEFGGAGGAAEDIFTVLVNLTSFFGFAGGEIGVAHDADEDVVEVVGDAAGDESESFEFLGFVHFGFEFASCTFVFEFFGDVAGDGEGAADLTGCVAKGFDGGAHV